MSDCCKCEYKAEPSTSKKCKPCIGGIRENFSSIRKIEYKTKVVIGKLR